MKKTKEVVVSWLLIVSILLSMIPSTVVLATESEKTKNTNVLVETATGETTSSTTHLSENASVVKEDITLRGKYEKHFLMSDGSYQVALYNEPVHKVESGEWVEIDNTLSLQTTSYGSAQYATVNGLADVSFAQSFEDQLVTIQQGDYSVSWGVQAFSGSLSMNTTAELVQPVQAELVTSHLSDFSVEEQKTMATKSSSTIQYRNALRQNVDLEYVVLPSRVKENIILQSAQDISYYVVTVYAENLSARLLENREIEFYNDSGEVVFTMTSPYMYDSVGELSENITVEMTSKGDGCYLIKMIPDAQWLGAESRVYPVVIDPQVSVDTTRTNIIDNYVLEGAGVQNRNLDRLYIGNRSEGLTRAFIKYDTMPTLPEGATITAATMTLTLTNGTDTASNAIAYQVGSDWGSGTIAWANMPSLGTPQAFNISHNNMTQYSFSCLEAVKEWYTNSNIGKNQNYGIMLRYYDETVQDYNAVYSADYTDESKRPLLVIAYVGSGGGTNFASAKTIYLDDSEYVNTFDEGEKRYFKFTPAETAEYVIMSNNYTGDPKVWIYNSGYSQITSQDDVSYPSNKNFWLKYTLQAGSTYYIGAGHAASQVGGYHFVILKSAKLANGFYHVRNNYSGKRLDICGPVEQIYVHQWTAHTGEQEKWLLQSHIENNQIAYYTIRSQYGENKYVGISSTNTGENNVQLFDNISDETKWNIYSTSSGTYYFEPFAAKGRGIYAANSNAGTKMQLSWIILSRTNTKWFMDAYTYSDVNFTFSAFDMGDSSQDEAALVNSKLAGYGYTSIGTYNNKTNYIPLESPIDVGRYSDIIYINSHGGRGAYMWHQTYNGTTATKDGYICADARFTEGDGLPIAEVGAKFKSGSSTITNSKWNLRTKWAIFGGCHQLSYQSNSMEGSVQGLWYNADWWAATMLGDGVRMHGILGYYKGAPPADVSYDRLNNFLTYANNRTILNAWRDAHSQLFDASTNWAMVYHSANAEDTIYNYTDSTPTGSAYNIYIVMRERAQQIMYSIDPAVPYDANGLIANEIPVFTDSADRSAVNNVYSNLQKKLCLSEYDNLVIDQNDKISYTNSISRMGEEDLGMSITEDEAVKIALKMLKDLGLSPTGDYRATVSTINRYRMDLTGQNIGTPETIEYTVSIYRTVNGLDFVSDEEDGIVISFDKYGLTTLHYKWRDITTTSVQQVTATRNAITEQQARNTYKEQMAQSGMDLSDDEIIVRKAYVQDDQNVRAVWVCSYDYGYGNHIFVDCNSGEIITI